MPLHQEEAPIDKTVDLGETNISKDEIARTDFVALVANLKLISDIQLNNNRLDGDPDTIRVLQGKDNNRITITSFQGSRTVRIVVLEEVVKEGGRPTIHDISVNDRIIVLDGLTLTMPDIIDYSADELEVPNKTILEVVSEIRSLSSPVKREAYDLLHRATVIARSHLGSLSLQKAA